MHAADRYAAGQGGEATTSAEGELVAVEAGEVGKFGEDAAHDQDEGEHEGGTDDEVSPPGHAANGIVVFEDLFVSWLIEDG